MRWPSARWRDTASSKDRPADLHRADVRERGRPIRAIGTSAPTAAYIDDLRSSLSRYVSFGCFFFGCQHGGGGESSWVAAGGAMGSGGDGCGEPSCGSSWAGSGGAAGSGGEGCNGGSGQLMP